MPLPIEYIATVTDANGLEYDIDLRAPDWRKHPAFNSPKVVSLKRIEPGSPPAICVELGEDSTGIERQLVLYSRVFGTINGQNHAIRDLFRLYCLGWEAKLSEMTVTSLNWIYPGGAIVNAPHPLFVDALIREYSKLPPHSHVEDTKRASN
jgi:hypothetical protein